MNCPECERLLYSRRHKTCGFCGAELPEECLFTAEEAAAIAAEQKAINDRRAADKAKEEKEKGKGSGEAYADSF